MAAQLHAAFDPTRVSEGDWFHARRLVENCDQNGIEGIVWFLSSLSADNMNLAQSLFDNYDLNTIRSIFEFLSRSRHDSTTTLRSIASHSSRAWTVSSNSSIFSDASRTSATSESSTGKFATVTQNAVIGGKGNRGTSKSDYPCFCTFHQERGEPKPLNRKSDWKRHEDDFHNSDELWHCRWCSEKFGSFRALEAHCKNKRVHSKTPSKNEVLSERFLPRVRFACGFPACKYNGLLHTWDKRCDHLADHMKESAELKQRGRGEDQWAPDQWDFSTRLLRLLKQPETEPHWKNLMTSTHGPDEVRWPTYWKLNDRSLTLVHKLECRDFRPSPKEVAECAVYLAWSSSAGNAPNASRFDNFIRKVVRLPVDSLPSRLTPQDFDMALKRFCDAQLRSMSFNRRVLQQNSPPASLAGNDNIYGNNLLQTSLITHPSGFGNSPALDHSFNFKSFADDPFPYSLEDFQVEDGPHPGTLWVPNQGDLPWYDPNIPDSIAMNAMDVDADTSSSPQQANIVGSTAELSPSQRHRTPGKLLRHMASSFSLPHRRSSSG